MTTFFIILSLFASFYLGYFLCVLLSTGKVSDLEAEVSELKAKTSALERKMPW